MKIAVLLAGVASLIGLVSCGGSTGKDVAASPQSLQDKMAIVQQQYAAEQAVLHENKDAILNVISGGGPGAGAPPTLFDLLSDPSILLDRAGTAAENTPPETLLADWSTHADAWCKEGPADWDDDFFLVYGGPHVLSTLVAFIDATCGKEKATALVAAADAQGLADGMAASGDPGAGIDLHVLLDHLDE